MDDFNKEPDSAIPEQAETVIAVFDAAEKTMSIAGPIINVIRALAIVAVVIYIVTRFTFIPGTVRATVYVAGVAIICFAVVKSARQLLERVRNGFAESSEAEEAGGTVVFETTDENESMDGSRK